MAEHGSRDFWRTRCEQLIASGMKVHDWCALNHVHAASMYEWLKRFHREDPSMFDGIGLPEGMEGYGHGWYEAVRKAYAEAHAIVPQRLSAASFAVVDTDDLAPRGPRPRAEGITVTIGAATVSCPVGCDAATLAVVLGAVSAL